MPIEAQLAFTLAASSRSGWLPARGWSVRFGRETRCVCVCWKQEPEKRDLQREL